jgi:hypothetical protein
MRVAIARQRVFTRTCAQGGTTWTVPRSARRWRSRLASRFLAGVGLRRATVARNAALITSRSTYHAASRLTDNQPRHSNRDRGVSWSCPGIWLRVNQQDQQAIDDLFQHLNRTAAQAGPRDRQAEARIQQHIQQAPPGLLYHMAQTLVGQQAALRQLRAQLADCQQQLRQGGAPAGFAQPGRRSAGQQGYGGYAPQ